MKKFLSILLISSMICMVIPITISAEDGTKYGDYLYYEIDDNSVTITDCDESATEITIPSEIEGVPVKEIGVRAFFNCSNLTKVVIPESVEQLSMSAFMACSNLSEIEIPNGVKYIEDSAFLGCENLKKVSISKSVEYLGHHVFFTGDNLTSIDVDKENEEYSSEGGVLFNKDQTRLMKYPPNKAGESYTISSLNSSR